MKTLFTVLMLTLTTAFSYAQQTGNVILFASGGERFYAVLNGVRQNASPETNIKITDLKAEGYKMNIQFEDPSIPAMMGKNLYVHLGNEVTYEIKQNKKGKWVVRFVSEVPLSQAPAGTAPTVAYHATPVTGTATTTTTATPTTTATATTTQSGTTTSETVTTTTTTTSSSSGETVQTGAQAGDVGVNMGVNVSESGDDVSININMSGMDGTGTTTGTSTSSTTVTTTTTTSGTMDMTADEPVTAPIDQPKGGCFGPMSDADYNKAKSSIASKDFSDSKMKVAQQVTKSNCLTAAQIKGIAEQFDFEDDKLEYAKFAYPYAYDQNNYYQVNDAFEFESTIEELDAHIKKQ